MGHFLYLYRISADSAPLTASPSEANDRRTKWCAWFHELSRDGHAQDLGHPLGAGGVVSKEPRRSELHVDATGVVFAYSVVKASSLHAAIELAHRCPIVELGGSVEVRPLGDEPLEEHASTPETRAASG